jgi:hypothetical protein
MNRTRTISALLVTLLTVAGGWFFNPMSETAQQTTPTLTAAVVARPDQGAPSTQTLTQLHEELAAVKQEQRALKHSLKGIEATLNRLAASSNVPTQTVATSEERLEDEAAQKISEEQQTANMLAALNQRLTKEGDDPSWGPEAETRIASLFSTEKIKGSRIRRADCFSTLCRVEVDHDDVEAQERMGNNLPMEPPFDGETMIQRIDDPLGPRTLLYVARQGHVLQGSPQ